MARVNKSQYAILGFLAKRDLSGYGLLRTFARISPFYWSESNAQVYPMLKKLEKEGMVVSKLDETSGARKKRIYSITEQGKMHLMKWCREPLPESCYREELCLRLGLGQFLDQETLQEKLNDFKRTLDRQRCEFVDMRRHIRDDHKDRPDQPFLDLNLDYVEAMMDAKEKWCKHAMTQVKKIKKKVKG